MREINIADSILNKRKEKGLTQDDLAGFMGVSKASVSKWETRQSYPDITLLPQLAALFNISIDELMGYEPQMAKMDIRKLYHQLSIDFSTRPFYEVLNHCREIIKKYYSCFPLLFQIGALLVNHSMLVKESDETAKILEEARGLFVRVKTESADIELTKQALNMESLCLLSLNRPKEVLDLLDSGDMLLTSTEPLLSSAYQMIGKGKEAKSVLQIGIYQYLIGLLNLLSSYQGLCLDDPAAFEETVQRILKISEVFQIKKLHPSILMSFYITAAQNYMMLGDTDKALELLEQYTELATGVIYPLHLHGDTYFTFLDDWIENTLALGVELPRDERIIRQSITEAVSANPVFTALADHPRFQRMVLCLKNNEEA